jgi:hypothetical protein
MTAIIFYQNGFNQMQILSCLALATKFIAAFTGCWNFFAVVRCILMAAQFSSVLRFAGAEFESFNNQVNVSE